MSYYSQNTRQEQTGVNEDIAPRSAWWWETGPVDSCCCCFSLRTGVGILAAMQVLAVGTWLSMWLIVLRVTWFVERSKLVPDSDTGTFVMEYDASSESKHFIGQLADHTEGLQYLLGPLGIEAVVLSAITGVSTLWVTFGSNTIATKIYHYTWPLRVVRTAPSVLGWFVAVVTYSLGWKLIVTCRLFVSFYFLKVFWSYDQVLKRRTQSAEYARAV